MRMIFKPPLKSNPNGDWFRRVVGFASPASREARVIRAAGFLDNRGFGPLFCPLPNFPAQQSLTRQRRSHPLEALDFGKDEQEKSPDVGQGDEVQK
jgi:hypothetical protein